METLDNKISRNFTALKSISILVIVAAHFYGDIHILWVPAALGLFIFAYSSAYFTSLKYGHSYDLKKYLLKKIYRIGINLLTINIFLFCLFSLQGKDNIWNMKTLLSFFGLTGLLDWLRIYIDGPFGAGMWFLTLLFIFYAIYPWLNMFLRKKVTVYLFFFVSIILFSWLNRSVIYGHALWLTSCGFICGFVSARTRINVPGKLIMGAIVISLAVIIILNFVMVTNEFNFILLLLLFCSFLLSVQYITFPKIVHSTGHLLSQCTLEIYLIHTALFIRMTEVDSIDILLSLLCILSLSLVLAWLSKLIRKHLIGDSVHGENRNVLLSIRNSD